MDINCQEMIEARDMVGTRFYEYKYCYGLFSKDQEIPPERVWGCIAWILGYWMLEYCGSTQVPRTLSMCEFICPSHITFNGFATTSEYLYHPTGSSFLRVRKDKLLFGDARSALITTGRIEGVCLKSGVYCSSSNQPSSILTHL
jgi:hypothetical protein